MTGTVAPVERLSHYAKSVVRAAASGDRSFWVKLGLVATWIYVLSWGEHRSFTSKISSCHWDNWEDWPTGASPHHLVLLADPQLIDPHTYPGRPWPLNSATYAHTDQYLRRTYDSIQYYLDPDSTVFLGDLFDGGREWSTGAAENPDKQWKYWGQSFWLQEYARWGNIFLRGNGQTMRQSDHPRGDRKFIASLPGNHDLGISSGVRDDVRRRFWTYFGEGNRVDVIGNHTIVSVDSPSLLAKALEPAKEREDKKGIWGPTNDFLEGVQKQKAQAFERYLAAKFHKPENPRHDHAVVGIQDAVAKEVKSVAGPGVKVDVPTILLTHIPLYRAKGYPCGPLREKYPPTKGLGDAKEPIVDERNAISLHGGYQYQNVLEPEISQEIVEKVGNVAHVFSGDDHDYCEVVHKDYTPHEGGLREITVKSISWAMGVRKPGFLLVSLWNPVDETGAPLSTSGSAGKPTIQTKLCIQPDTLGNFIRYGELFLFTVAVLLALSFFSNAAPNGISEDTVLPLTERRSWGRTQDVTSGSASSNSSDSNASGTAARARGKSLGAKDGWAMSSLSLNQTDTYSPTSRSPSRRTVPGYFGTSKRKNSQLRKALDDCAWSLAQVGGTGFLFYCWLAYYY